MAVKRSECLFAPYCFRQCFQGHCSYHSPCLPPTHRLARAQISGHITAAVTAVGTVSGVCRQRTNQDRAAVTSRPPAPGGHCVRPVVEGCSPAAVPSFRPRTMGHSADNSSYLPGHRRRYPPVCFGRRSAAGHLENIFASPAAPRAALETPRRGRKGNCGRQWPWRAQFTRARPTLEVCI